MYVTNSAAGPNLPRLFMAARGHLARAEMQREALLNLWKRAGEISATSVWAETPDGLTHEIWCSFQPPKSWQQEAEGTVREFILATKEALDACVLSTAVATCGGSGVVRPVKHAMPLCRHESEFEELPYSGHLMGLRADQMDLIRHFQPFSTEGDGLVSKHLVHLAEAVDALDQGRPLFAVWAAAMSTDNITPPARAVETIIDRPGVVNPRRCIASLRPGHGDFDVLAGRRISFDPIVDAPPWPEVPNDNWASRSQTLLRIVMVLLRGLERSVNSPGRTAEFRALHAEAPDEPGSTWLPVSFENVSEQRAVRTAIEESGRALATYRMPSGALIYVRLREGSIVGREIPPASVLAPGGPFGAAVEDATRATAAGAGLPDFVFKPTIVKKGSGIREVGDGTILSGRRGIALQVKARDAEGDTDDRARAWLLKNARAGLRQARGTVRTSLSNPRVRLTNLRGRAIDVRGGSVEWVPVVVLDHPNLPSGVVPEPDPAGSSVVLTRQDWEFLWGQLRSATAIVDYVHRVSAESPLELGSETNRYFDVAALDSDAPPAQPISWSTSHATAVASSVPAVPQDPASATDEVGFAVFQRILDDLAATDFAGDESIRLDLLSLIDQVAVAARAELGRLLLKRLIECADAPLGAHRLQHRIMFLGDGDLQLSFSTMTVLTGYHREMYRQWLMHRRQRFLSDSGSVGPVWPWTVGVLLTPRPGGGPLWDTTTLATNGPPQFGQEEFARLGEAYESLNDLFRN